MIHLMTLLFYNKSYKEEKKPYAATIVTVINKKS